MVDRDWTYFIIITHMCQQEYRWLRENVGYKYLVPFVNAQKKIEHFLSSRNLKRHVFQLLAFSKILFWVNMALRFIHLVLSALVTFKLEALTALKDIYRTFVLSVSKLVTNSLHIFFADQMIAKAIGDVLILPSVSGNELFVTVIYHLSSFPWIND